MRSERVHVAVKRAGGSLEHLERDGRHDVRLLGDQRGALRGLRADRGDQLRAVDERESLLGAELDGGEVVALEDVLGLAPPGGGGPHLPLAHEAQSQVGERRQVTCILHLKY